MFSIDAQLSVKGGWTCPCAAPSFCDARTDALYCAVLQMKPRSSADSGALSGHDFKTTSTGRSDTMTSEK